MVSQYFQIMMRLALVGVGEWGKNYISTISQMSSCTLTHICAKSKTTLDSFPRHFKKTTKYQDLIKEKKLIDGVIIATPAATHYSIADYFIRAEVPVLIEKPVTTQLSQALILQKLVKQHNSTVIVGHEYLYNPAFIKLKTLLPGLGNIIYVNAESGNWGPFRKDVSCLWDWGPHDIAMAVDLFDTIPRSVQAWGVLEDVVYLRLNFTFASVFITLSRLLPEKKRLLTLVGKNCILVYDELAGKKLAKYMKNPELKTKISYPRYYPKSSLTNEVTAFIEAIKYGRQPKTHIGHAVNVSRILDACEQSIAAHGRVIPL